MKTQPALKWMILGFVFFLHCQLQAQNALDFDGTDDKVDCGNDTSVQIKGSYITLEAWVYPTAWKTNPYDGNVICKEDNTSNYGYMLRVGGSGQLNFAIGNGSWHEITTGTILSLNSWQHIAGTYDGNKMRVYLNGSAVDSLTFSGAISNASTTNLTIGAHPAVSYVRFYQGMIDEVRIWNIQRSQKQIADNMYSEFCSKTKGMRAYYKFNHGKAGGNNTSVKSMTDYSGFKNTAALSSFTLIGSSSNWLKGMNLTKSVTKVNDTLVRCDRFYSPSGKYKWFSSGVYRDTIPTVMGCDSAITYYLTIKKSTSKAITVYACTSYKSPSGAYTWTQSGTYTDYLINSVKCDSVVTINLKIGGSRDTIRPFVCKKFTVPSGRKTYSATGQYSDTLKNFRGCDSVIAIYLTIMPPTYAIINARACKAYTSPSGKYTWKQNGTYKDTIVNAKGCDSVLTINLVMNNSSSSIKRTACNNWVSPSGKTWTKTGIYYDTILNFRKCDSVITVDLTIKNSTFATINTNSCRIYTSPSKKYTWRNSGTYKDTLFNKQGCDSILTINLKIIRVNTGVVQASTVLTSLSTTGTYQWLNCTLLKTPVNGETGKSFKATMNAEFAVEVTDSGCRDTSSCYAVVSAGFSNAPDKLEFQIFPNPNQGDFTLTLAPNSRNSAIRILDLSGKIMYEEIVGNANKIYLNLALKKGIYLVQVLNGNNTVFKKLEIE